MLLLVPENLRFSALASVPYLLIGTLVLHFHLTPQKSNKKSRGYIGIFMQVIHDVVKEYPEMIQIYIYHNGYTLSNNRNPNKRTLSPEEKAEESIHRSIRRTKSTITDIIICNQFDMWCTFTFDPKKINRYDPIMCKSKMSAWLRNQRRTSPDLKYLIVAEKHKDGAIHFHALIKGFNGRTTKTKLIQNGHQVYKFSGFRWGRSHFVNIGQLEEDYTKVGIYMQKYITKDMLIFEGKKRYWVSNNLTRPINYVNGVTRFGLQKIIKNHIPKYINEYFETQIHYKSKTLQLKDVDLTPQLPVFALPPKIEKQTKSKADAKLEFAH